MANREEKVRFTPAFKAEMVAAYLGRDPDESSAEFAKRKGLKDAQQIQNWAWEARKNGPKAGPADKNDAVALPASAVKSVGSDGRKSYTEEFKLAAVKRYMDAEPPIPVNTVARETGVHFTLLGNWIKKYGAMRTGKNSREEEAPPPDDPRQIALFQSREAAAVHRVEPHVTPQAVERLKNEITKLHEEVLILKEDNAILRGIATVAQRRGYLNLFGKGDGK